MEESLRPIQLSGGELHGQRRAIDGALPRDRDIVFLVLSADVRRACYRPTTEKVDGAQVYRFAGWV